MQQSVPPQQGLATASLVCGILTIPSCWLTFIPAIIMGHIAWSRSAGSPVRPGRAKVGLIVAYSSLLAIPLIAALAGLTAPLVIRQRDKADLAEVISNTRAIGSALTQYHQDHDRFPPDLKALETEGILPSVEQMLRVSRRHPGNWTYCPDADPENGSAPLLVSPLIRDRHAVLTVDGAARPSPTPPPPSDGAVIIPAPLK
jgi:type II secretory pathway pseudopilin PulG